MPGRTQHTAFALEAKPQRTTQRQSAAGVGRCGLLVIGVMLAFSACMPRSQLIVREQLVDRDLRLGFADAKNRDSGDFAEQVVVRGVLSDGGSVYAKLTVANIANADGRADFTIDVKLADGRRAKCKTKKSRGDWELANDRMFATVGEGTVEVTVGRAVVTADCDAFKAVVTIETELPPLRPPGGVFEQGGAFYMTTLPIPRGRLTVVVEPNEALPRVSPTPEGPDGPEVPDGADPAGQDSQGPPDKADEAQDTQDGTDTTDTTDTPKEGSGDEGDTDSTVEEVDTDLADADEELEPIEVDGVGYVEHRAGNLPPYRLAHAWYNILQIDEDVTFIMSGFEKAHTGGDTERGKARGWLLVVNDDGLVLYEPILDLWVRGSRNDDVTNYSLPELIFLGDPKREVFKGVIKPGTLSKRKDDLANLKKLERLVVRRFMKPWTFTYNHAEYLFRRQPMGEPMTEQRGTTKFLYQQLDE